MSLARKPIYSQRRVVTAPYLVDGLGRLRPQRPSRCPSGSAEEICKVVWHGYRQRKCGVTYPLAMCRCRVHNGSFTVYPPGWSPFGRRGVVDISPAGFDIDQRSAGLDDWVETVFGATVDASAGRVWPQTASGITIWRGLHGRDPYGVTRTQRRHIAGANALFALSKTSLDEQVAVVAAIGINLSDIVQAAGRVRDGPRLVAEGKRGADILSALGKPSRRLLPGINKRGVTCEYWGPQAENK